MRSNRRVAAFFGTAAIVLGLLEVLWHPISPSGMLLFTGGVIAYPDTRALVEGRLGRELPTRVVAGLFLLCWLLSGLALVFG